MTYTVVVFEKGAVNDPETVRSAVDAMNHGAWPDPIVTNPGYSVRISKFKSPPLAVYAKGAIDDEAALREELNRGLAIVQLNPGYTIEFIER